MNNPSRDSSDLDLFRAAGKHNVSPWPYLLGIGGAVIAVLFAWQASLRAQQKSAKINPANQASPAKEVSSPAPKIGSDSERLIWIE